MINHSAKDGKLTFAVQVVPRSSLSQIVGEHNGVLRVRIAAAPVDGAANEELVRLLARALGVRRGAVEITSGQTSKIKRIQVTGVKPSALASLAAPHRGER
jgi:uncharacterized protein